MASIEPQTTIQKASKAAPWTILAKLLMAATNLTLIVMIPKFYSKDTPTYGTYELLKYLVLVSPVLFGLGMEKVIPRFLPELISLGNRRGARRLLWGGGGVVLVSLVVEIGLLAMGGSYIDKAKGTHLFDYLLLISSLAGMLIYRTFLYNICIARFRTRVVSLANLVSCPVWVGLTCWFLVGLEWDIRGIFLAQLISVVIQVGFMLWSQAGAFLHGGVAWECVVDQGEATPRAGIKMSRLFRLVLPALVSGVQFAVVTMPGELVFIFFAKYRGGTDTGHYGLAYNLTYQGLGVFILPIYSLAMAGFSEMYTRDATALKQGIRDFYKFLFTLLVPLAMLGVFLGEKIVLVVIGGDWKDAASWVPIFSIYHIFGIIFIPITVALITREKWMVMIPISLFQIVSILLLNSLLIPAYGATGAMIAKFSTVAVSSVATLWVARRVLGWINLPLGYLIKTILSTGSVFILYPLRAHVTTIPELILFSALSCVVMVLGIRVSGLIGANEAKLIAKASGRGSRLVLAILVKKRYNDGLNGR